MPQMVPKYLTIYRATQSNKYFNSEDDPEAVGGQNGFVWASSDYFQPFTSFGFSVVIVNGSEDDAVNGNTYQI